MNKCKCKICNVEFKTNSGGDLTKHISNVHKMTLSQYTIQVEYNGISPICECGFCSDIPEFYRGKFKKYTKGHTSAQWYQDNYIRVNGHPTCDECGCNVSFRKGRKVFPRFCSTKCSGTHNKDVIIEKMRPKIIKRYDTDPEYRKKVSIAVSNRFNDSEYYNAHIERTTKWNQSNRARAIKSVNSKLMWSDDGFSKRQSELIKHSTNSIEEKKRRSIQQKARWKDPITGPMYYKALMSISKRFSKLHVRIRNKLQLDSLGFKGEQKIGRYCVDELHLDKKIIIEVNGDYVHANPKIYKSDDIIRLYGSSYTAEEKWDSDYHRLQMLESMGYVCLVIWESDDLDIIRNKLNTLLK